MRLRPTWTTLRGTAYLGVSVSALAAAAVLTACAGGPAPANLTVGIEDGYRQSTQPGAFVDGAWWTGYGDPRLAALVERAAASNHDVRVAVERVRQARA